jgi:hypothetical protein
MLHIINGDSTVGTLEKSEIQGDKFSFRDALIYGPTPAGVEDSAWLELRANHLSDFYSVELERCRNGLLEQEQVLSTLDSHDEVVLWFEHDLFCQVNLLYLLHRFARMSSAPSQTSLINVGSFPGKDNFRGLGELDVEELASLFPARTQLTKRELDLGADAWNAYCSADPTAMEGLLARDTSALPFLETAFHAHLQRFPSVSNGLGQIENRGLDLIERGLHKFNQVFPRFVVEEGVYGLGDSQFWLSLKQLARVPVPLLSFDKADSELEEFSSVDMEITDTGREVLKNEADYVDLNGVDCWIGGVQLSGRHQIWRWDAANQRLELR